MARNVAFRTLSSILPTKGQHIAAVTTPVGSQVCEWFETVRDPVIDLFLVPILEKHRYTTLAVIESIHSLQCWI